MVEHASDDELFASGYLRGHLTLAIAELESGDDHSVEAVYANVSQSLEKRSVPANCRRAIRR
ncbi:YfcL protein [Salmonella enterica subsp. arizonae]|nr:YfcL protein [Salmonella enterica subsp. arizonae]